MVSPSFLAGRPLFLVLALVLVCLSLCVPRVVGDFGFANWSPPAQSSVLQSSSGTPTAVEFNNIIHIVYRSATSLFYVSSTNGYSFTSAQQLEGFVTSTDPYLVVVTDQGSQQPTLVLLTGGGSGSTSLYYSIYNGASSGFPFPVPVNTTALSNLGGDVDAVYSTGFNTLIIAYLSNIYAYTTNGGDYYRGYQLTATITYGAWSSSPVSSIGSEWRPQSAAAVFNVGSNTYLIQGGGSNGVTYYWTSKGFSITQGLTGVALDAAYSGFVATSFVAPPFITALGSWASVFYISPSDTSLAYSLVGPGSSASSLQLSSPRPIGFIGGQSVDLPRQPVAVYYAQTQALYVYYLDFSDTPERIESINTTLNF